MDEPPLPSSEPAPDGADASRASRRRRISAAVAVLVLAGAGIGIGLAVTGSHGPRARVGQFLSSYEEDQTHSTPVEVRLPWGSLSISIGSPVSRIPDSSTCTDHTCDVTYDQLAPPPGGSWIPFALEPEASPDGLGLFRTSATTSIPPVHLSIGSGDSWTPVALLSGGNPKASVATLFVQATDGWLALPDTPERPSIRVTFAGVTQTVDMTSGHRDAGLAAPLYQRQAAFRTHRCERGSVPGYRETYVLSSECQLTGLTSVPYVAGLGWAKPGRSWLVALVRTYPPGRLVAVAGPRQGKAVYSDQDSLTRTWHTALRYGAVRPEVSTNYNGVSTSLFQDPDDPDLFIFGVPAGDTGRSHPFTVVTRFHTSYESIPRHRALTITRTLRVP